MVLYLVFFFFKQKTAYELRISDWSSDVCSSDLVLRTIGNRLYRNRAAMAGLAPMPNSGIMNTNTDSDGNVCSSPVADNTHCCQDRKSVVSGKSVAARVDLGGRRIIKIKKTRVIITRNNNRISP